MRRIFCVGAPACLFAVAVAVSFAGDPVEDATPPRNAASTSARAKPSDDVPENLRLEPWWREKGDCGPLALFVLMQLQNKQVALDDVKKLIQIDPEEGCSLKSLQAAAEQLGLATETRFVEPRDLSDVPGPFIVHGLWSIAKSRGHFFLLLGYDSKKDAYATIDTTTARLGWLPKDTVRYGYSGYILIPKGPAGRQWNRWTGYGLLLIGGAIFSLWSYGMFRRRQRGKAYRASHKY